jgi:hypothetical protein
MILPGKLLRPALLFSGFLCIATAYLGAAENGAQTVQVKIGSILASNQSDEFDARLAPMQKQFKAFKYRSYRLLKEESQSVRWQGIATFEIPGGRKLFITPQEIRDKQISLRGRLQEGEKPLVNTVVRIPNRGNFLLGGPPHEGGVLIISISAETQ